MQMPVFREKTGEAKVSHFLGRLACENNIER